MTVLLINSSIRSNESVSRQLSNKLADRFKDSGNKIIKRDLAKNMYFVSEESFNAGLTPAKERTTGQKNNKITQLADEMIKELQDSNIIIIGSPVYNFGAPASLKAWADLVARAGTTFRYTANGPEGLLKEKKAYIMAVSGGVPIGSDMDFMSSWLKFFLGFLGITDVEMVKADGVMSKDGEEKIKAAHQAIEKLKI